MSNQVIHSAGGRTALGSEVLIGHHVKAVSRQIAIDDKRIAHADRLQQKLNRSSLGLDFQNILLIFSAPIEQAFSERIPRHGPCKVKALDQITIACTQETELLFRLHALCNGTDVQSCGEQENALQDDALSLILAVLLQKRPINLDFVRECIGHHAQRGQPAAKVIDGELEPDRG